MAEQVIDIQKKVRIRLEKSNARYKGTTDKKRREKMFKEGDMVMVYLRKGRIPVGSYKKLKPRKYEPFRIARKINDNAYIVNIPSDMVMFKTFNVADLHKYYPTKELYPDDNSRMSCLEEGGTDAGDQE